MGNNEATEVKGRGTMSISTISSIKTILEVLYTPNMSQILLSVVQMLDNNYSIHFKKHERVVSQPFGLELFYVMKRNKIFLVIWEKQLSMLTLLLHTNVQTYSTKGLVSSI